MSTTRSRNTRLTHQRMRSLPLLSVLPFLALASTVGCGDDGDDAPSVEAGKGGSAGSGSSGKGGKAGNAGSSGGSKASGGSSSGDAGQSGEGGEGATSGSSGGSSGGSDAGAGGDQGGEGGEGATAGGGSGGTGATAGNGGTSGGGNGGSGGTGPVTYAPITQVADLVVTGVNELRGLVYARSGKIYAVGHVGDSAAVEAGTDRQVAIVRFNANGTLDTDFGTEGVVSHNLVERTVDEEQTVTNSGDEQAWGIVELEDDSFLVQVNLRDAAGTGNDVALLRIDEDGAPVNGFGSGGLKRVDFGWVDETDHAGWPTAGTTPSDQGWGLQLDNSTETEKVVVFGYGPAKVGAMTTGQNPVQRTDNDRYVTRLIAATGERDPGFNGDGTPYTLNSGGTFGDNGRRGIVLDDGTIYAAGYTNFGAGLENHVMVIKLTPAGTPDPSFRYAITAPGVSRTNGFLNDGGAAECYQVGLLSDGRVVTTGYGRATAAGVLSSLGWETTSSQDLVAFALLPSGAPDLDWGRSGTLAIQSEGIGRQDTEERGRDLVVLPDDRAVHVGRFGGNPAIFVVKPDGELDEGSGVDGRFEYDTIGSPTSHFYAVALSPDLRSIVASTNDNAAGVRVAFLSVAAE